MDYNTDSSSNGVLEQKKDAGLGERGEVRQWLLELTNAQNREKSWHKMAQDAINRYSNKKQSQFNILWSNTEVLRPALYNSTPRPDVRRRYRDSDPTGKEIAQVMERALSFSLDSYDFDEVIGLAILDYLLSGRGVTRVKFEPSFEKVTPPPMLDLMTGQPIQQEPVDTLSYAETLCEHVSWDCFTHGPGRNPSEITWIAFKHIVTKDEAEKRFGKIAGKISLDYKIENTPENVETEDDNVYSRGVVWEIWDKEKREVLFVAPCYTERFIKRTPDPLKLQGFFPIPKPLLSVKKPSSLVPLPEYELYKSQAKELEEVSSRIARLTNMLKVRGIYDATMKEFSQLLEAEDGVLVPSEAALQAMSNGGLDKAIWMQPIEVVANVLAQLYIQRDQIKQTIYELTGLADIMRGASDPNETLGAQQLKAANSASRLKRRQREIQQYVRDIIRIKAEIIAENYTPELLTIMTGTQVTPEMIQVMKNDGQRGFRIDVETDSTIAADEQMDKEQATELITGIGGFAQSIAPAIQGGVIPTEAAQALLLSLVRKHKMGRHVEDALETAAEQQKEQQGQPKPPSPEEMKAQADKQAQEQQFALEREKMAFEREKAMAELELKRELEMHKINMETQSRKEIAEAASKPTTMLQVDAQGAIDGVAESLGGASVSLQTIAEQQAQMSADQSMVLQASVEAMQQAVQAMAVMVAQISAPKRLVRDSAGRAVGVETITG